MVAPPAEVVDPPAQAVDSAVTIDVLLLGDSITNGQGGKPGFRDDLRNSLIQDDPLNTYQFIGSTGDPPLQGHFLGGMQIDDFYPPNFGNGWGNGKFDVTSDMGPPQTPNLLAMHMGTNDLNSHPPPFAPYSLDHGQTLLHSQSGELAEFLRYVLQWHDGTLSDDVEHVVLSTIIPMQNRALDVLDFNREVIAMSEDFAEGVATGQPVKVTIADHNRRFLTNPDLFTGGPNDWMSDPLHPNDVGYAEMGDVYKTAFIGAVNDIVPPEPVTDLAVIAVGTDRISLAFTTSGDDAAAGHAYRYDVRSSTGMITSSNFGLATQAYDEPEPPAAGEVDTVEVTGLFPGTTYSFALKVVDDGGNRSTVSNVRTATTIGGGNQTVVLRQGLNGYNGGEDNVMIDTRGPENLGGVSSFWVGRHGSGDIYRSLIRFDLSAIPANATIVEAKLEAFSWERDNSTPVVVGAYRVTKHWVEGSRTFPSQQVGSSCWNAARLGELNWSQPGVSAASDGAQNDDPNFDRYATPEDTETLTSNNTWYEWDVTNAAIEWVQGDWSNEGLVLIAHTEDVTNRRRFYSSEATTDPTRRPTLTITYTTGDVNSPPIAAAGGPYSGQALSLIQFNGSSSFDPESEPITYSWAFGDGETGSGAMPTHAYALPGAYVVSLVVDDGAQGSKPDTATALVGISLDVDDAGAPPLETGLLGADPNPFRGSTTISYSLAGPGPAALRIYDVQGRLVRTLADHRSIVPGVHRATWDGTQDRGGQAPRGVYFSRFTAAGIDETRKIIRLD
jgi:chitodextrinase